MRAGRLVAIVLSVQRRQRTTAAALADELGVSVRTIYRDVAALQSSGVPLWTETGPAGGIHLVEGWRFPLDGLTGDETAALVLGAGPEIAGELGLGSLLAVAESKVMSALPPELRSRAARMQRRFHLDAPGWFQQPRSTANLPLLAEAVWSDTRVDLVYGTGAKPAARRVDPLGLVLKGGVWYLVAAHRRVLRTYRVSRVRSATLRKERFERDPAFDLVAWWREASDGLDASILRLPVRLRLSENGLRRLPAVVPGVTTRRAVESAGPPDATGWRELELRLESELVARSQLASLGGEVEVLSPVTLRHALADFGQAIAARNA